MDLISTLAAQLGVDPKQAEGLAGSVLGQLQQNLPAEQAASVGAAVPELDAWKQAGGDGGALGGLLGALGGDQAALIAKVASLGITPDQILAAVPAILAFAKTRLPAPVVLHGRGALYEIVEPVLGLIVGVEDDSAARLVAHHPLLAQAQGLHDRVGDVVGLPRVHHSLHRHRVNRVQSQRWQDTAVWGGLVCPQAQWISRVLQTLSSLRVSRLANRKSIMGV